MLLASRHPQAHPATTGLVPVELLLASRHPQPIPPRRGSSVERAPASRHAQAHPATTGLVPVERRSSPAGMPKPIPPRRGSSPSRLLPASRHAQAHPATTGLVPVERAAPRQQACPSPSRHDGARPRRALLPAGMPKPIPPRRGSSPSSAAPRQHRPGQASRHERRRAIH